MTVLRPEHRFFICVKPIINSVAHIKFDGVQFFVRGEQMKSRHVAFLKIPSIPQMGEHNHVSSRVVTGKLPSSQVLILGF
jgi:hypothetical protein